MNTLSLDKSDPEIAAALEGCEVGKPKTLTITVTPTVDTDTKFEADVTAVEYAEEEPEAEEEEPSEEPEMPMKKSGGKMPHAVLVIGMQSKKAA